MGSARNTAIAATASALLFFFGTGFSPVPPLVLLAPLPLLFLASRTSALWTGIAAFLGGFFGAANNWAHAMDSVDVPLPMALGISAANGTVLALVALLFGSLVRSGRAVVAAIAAPAAWTAALYGVSLASPAGVVGTPANSFGDWALVLQPAAYAGMWGVEFLVFLVPAVIAALLAPGVTRVARLRAGVIGAVVVTVALAAGAVRLAGAGQSPADRHVALIAPNKGRWAADITSADGQALLQSYVDAIGALPGSVRLAVLAEADFGITPANAAQLTGPLARLARERGLDIVAGAVLRSDQGKANVAIVVPAGGTAPLTYTKQHDLGADILGTGRVTIPGSRTGIAICMDLNFADPARSYAAAGSSILAVPAADETANGWQHSRTGLLRGVENGLGVLWAGRSGSLMIADGWGQVLGETRTDTNRPGMATVVAPMPAAPGATVHTRLGDWFAWLSVGIAAGAIATTAASRRRSVQ
ncbi:carbon-nitrogen hydrolase family protein [Longispora albida]|uniref:carbon-nitrogen hydrolase family protein n=1 Tax=Longispora albida TaxID=203523 RepID=UPI000382135C|nr:carbon-nitrogen hydrolase family protein [Longispora albida]